MYESLSERIDRGEPVILDGGTGTEIQRRGVPMDGAVWCAMANLQHGAMVRRVHAAYIEAGAEVITANTYASSPVSFAALGREEEIEAIDRAAVAHAHAAAAVASQPVLVAGSISVMPAVPEGTDRATPPAHDPKRLRPLYRRKAELLADAGCDLLIMEMMRDLRASLWATEAAVATGLPVWVGISAERGGDGSLVGYADGCWSLSELVGGLMETGAAMALIMHHDLDLTEEALGVIRAEWDGPMGAYPEAGHFEMPDWVFRDIDPVEFARAAEGWIGAGAVVVGGCCGTTPEHIAALVRALRSD